MKNPKPRRLMNICQSCFREPPIENTNFCEFCVRAYEKGVSDTLREVLELEPMKVIKPKRSWRLDNRTNSDVVLFVKEQIEELKKKRRG